MYNMIDLTQQIDVRMFTFQDAEDRGNLVVSSVDVNVRLLGVRHCRKGAHWFFNLVVAV